MWKSYEGKPVTRVVHRIQDTDTVEKLGGEAQWRVTTAPAAGEAVTFKAYQEPVVGDWVVRLTGEDNYHCTDAVFRERNIVPE